MRKRKRRRPSGKSFAPSGSLASTRTASGRDTRLLAGSASLAPRAVFLGTPAFATHSLRALARLANARVVDLVAVVTRPERPGDRGAPAPRPVRDLANELGLRVLTDLAEVRRFAPDLLVWAAYGRKIPAELLLVRHGGLNVHASLLPRWRGPAPIQAALLAGDEVTGVTLMKSDGGIDTGPILGTRATEISPYDDATSLEVRLGELGGALLEEMLPRYLRGELEAVAQDESQATRSHRLTTEECLLDFTRPARELRRIVRAALPRPVARTFWKGQALLVWRTRVSDKAQPADPGRVWLCGDEVCVDTPDKLLVLQVVQPAGKRQMTGPEWARGARIGEGAHVPS